MNSALPPAANDCGGCGGRITFRVNLLMLVLVSSILLYAYHEARKRGIFGS